VIPVPEQLRRRLLITRWRLFARPWLAPAVCCLAITTFLFGLSGFAWQYGASTAVQSKSKQNDTQKTPAGQDWSIPIFETVQLFLLNSGSDEDADHPNNYFLIIARLSAAALFLILSMAVIVEFLDEVRRLPGNLTRNDHVVICGLGQIGLQLLDDLVSQKRAKNLVIVENNPAHPWLEYARSLGATIVIGDSTNANTLIDARAPLAREVFVVNGDDGVNLEVTAELGMLLDKQISRTKPLRLYVHIVDTNFATTLRPYCNILHDTPHMLVQVFNVPRAAAARLVTHQLWPHAPKESEEVAHYVILGFGPMGQALAVQLAQLGHFPNCKRSRFTIADQDIKKTGAAFLARFSRFTSWTNDGAGVDKFSGDCDAWDWNEYPLPTELRVGHDDAIQYATNSEFVDIPVGSTDERFAGKLASRFKEAGVKPVIFICGQQDRENFESAVQLRELLAMHGQADVPFFVWLPRQPALAEALSRNSEGRFYPFGECRSAASYQEITDPLREIVGIRIQAHYEKAALAKAKAEGREYTVKSWSALRDDYRESNRVAADHMLIKLQYVGVEVVRKTQPDQKGGRFTKDFSEHTRQVLAEMEHYRWVCERLLAGWRFCPMGATEDEIKAYKKLKFNHNITTFKKSEAVKDFDQIDVIYDECQKLDGFILKRYQSGGQT
jgi:voltage-gated potassium channel Kch